MNLINPHFNPDSPQRISDDENYLPSIVESVTDLGKNIIHTVAEKCPYGNELVDWGVNSYNYLNFGLAETIKKAMLDPETQTYYPIKQILLLQKIKLFVVTDPKYINEILQKLRYGDVYSGGNEFCILGNVIGTNSPLTEECKEAHQQEHDFANKYQFSAQVLKEKASTFHCIAKNFIQEHFNLSKTDVFNISEILPKYPIEVSTQVIFNLDRKIQNFDSLLSKLEKILNDSLLYHLKAFIPECIDLTKKQSKEELESIVNEILNYSQHNDNFIKKMLDENFSPNVVTSMIKTILVIGSGTTKSTLISAIYCLLKNPEYQETLYTCFSALDIDEETPNELLYSSLFTKLSSSNSNIEGNLNAAQEVECFLFEVMRLHSPIPVQARQNKIDLEIGDVKIKKGSTLFLANFLSYTDSKNWEDAHLFNPSRFAGEDGLLKRKNFRPFNWGRNICMGRNFANFMLVNFIYHFVMKYKIVPPTDLLEEPIEQNLKMSDAFTFAFDKEVYVKLVER